MEPSVAVGLLWLVFGGTHVGLASARTRAALVARLGEPGFTAAYFVVASVGFTALVTYYASHRDAGPPGLGGAAIPALRWAAIALVTTGIALVVPGLVYYPGSSYALFTGAGRREPRRLERITRHPFFVGLALVGIAHALLATRLVGTTFFLGLTLFVLGGAWHQDVKLGARRGASHEAFLATSSILPFAAILQGRQRLVWRELPLGALGAGVVVAWGLRRVHASILAHDGAYVIVAVVGGAVVAGAQAWRRARRREVRHG